MDYPATVQVLHSPEDLVEEDLDVVGREMLGGDDDLVEITLHEFSYEVDFLEKVNVRRLKLEIIMINWTKIKYRYNVDVCCNFVWEIKTNIESYYYDKVLVRGEGRGGGW